MRPAASKRTLRLARPRRAFLEKPRVRSQEAGARSHAAVALPHGGVTKNRNSDCSFSTPFPLNGIEEKLQMRVTRTMTVLGLITASLVAQIRPSTGQVEPDARLWTPWILASAGELRPGPPPDRAATGRELLTMRDAMASPGANVAQQLAYWNAGSP